MVNCIFCEVYTQKTDVIYEDVLFYSAYDRFPVSPGSALVIPKRHVVSLFDLTNEEWARLKGAITNTIGLIELTDFKKVYQTFIDKPLDNKSRIFNQRMLQHMGINRKPEGYNIAISEGEAAGISIPHFHVNIIPRFMGDMPGGQRGIKRLFPEFEAYTPK